MFKELLFEFVQRFKDFEIIWIWLLAILAFLLVLANTRRRAKTPTDPDLGKLLWVDEGKQTKPFFNKQFKVFGKPDAIYNDNGSVTAVEFKSRKGPIYVSDAAQAATAALAARGDGYKITQVVIKTKTETANIPLPKSDLELYDTLKESVEIARSAKKGCTMCGDPEDSKCIACAYKASCSDRAISSLH